MVDSMRTESAEPVRAKRRGCPGRNQVGQLEVLGFAMSVKTTW